MEDTETNSSTNDANIMHQVEIETLETEIQLLRLKTQKVEMTDSEREEPTSALENRQDSEFFGEEESTSDDEPISSGVEITSTKKEDEFYAEVEEEDEDATGTLTEENTLTDDREEIDDEHDGSFLESDREATAVTLGSPFIKSFSDLSASGVVSISATNPFEDKEPAVANIEPRLLNVGISVENIINLVSTNVRQVGFILFAGEELSQSEYIEKDVKFLLGPPLKSRKLEKALDQIKVLVQAGGGTTLKENAKEAIEALEVADKSALKSFFGDNEYKHLSEIVLNTMIEEEESSILQNWEISPPWVNIYFIQLTTKERDTICRLPIWPVEPAGVLDTLKKGLKEYTGLSLYDSSLSCVQVIETQWSIAKAIFFVLSYKNSINELDIKMEEHRFNHGALFKDINAAIDILSKEAPQQAKVLSKVGQFLGVSATVASPASVPTSPLQQYELGFLLSAVLPLYHASTQEDSFEYLPPALSAALKLHGEAQQSTSLRKILKQQTDPGEGVYLFSSGLDKALAKQLRKEVRKNKGFALGKVNDKTVAKIIRGDKDASNVVYVLVNMKTGREYVGTSEDSLGVAIAKHFKYALLPSSNGTTNNLRELHHAIRITPSYTDWRVSILEWNVPPHQFREKEKKYYVQYNTVWPNGYNV